MHLIVSINKAYLSFGLQLSTSFWLYNLIEFYTCKIKEIYKRKCNLIYRYRYNTVETTVIYRYVINPMHMKTRNNFAQRGSFRWWNVYLLYSYLFWWHWVWNWSSQQHVYFIYLEKSPTGGGLLNAIHLPSFFYCFQTISFLSRYIIRKACSSHFYL